MDIFHAYRVSIDTWDIHHAYRYIRYISRLYMRKIYVYIFHVYRICNVYQVNIDVWYIGYWCICAPLQHTATHCNTLQHTATHCNTLQLIIDVWYMCYSCVIYHGRDAAIYECCVWILMCMDVVTWYASYVCILMCMSYMWYIFYIIYVWYISYICILTCMWCMNTDVYSCCHLVGVYIHV